MLTHPSVADAAVVGIPDEQWGEAVAAVVVAKAGSSVDLDALKAMIQEQLRSSRVPQVIEIWKELPYNETGKLLRRVVKADLSKAYSLGLSLRANAQRLFLTQNHVDQAPF